VAIVVGAAVGAALVVVLGVALAPFARVFVHRAVLGIGPRLFARRFGAADVEVRAIPTHATLLLHGANLYEAPEETAAVEARMPGGRLLWGDAPAWRRVLAFVVVPRAVSFALAAAVLGPTHAMRSAGVGVLEIVRGVAAPLSDARATLDGGASILAARGFAVLVAVAMCKYLSLGLLSLASDLAFAAGQPRFAMAKARGIVMLLLLVPPLVWFVAWLAWALH
jgi:hypothetical protein